MRFPYSSVVLPAPDGGDFFLLRRPEIPVTIVGTKGSFGYIGLVDTGSDFTILPKSLADDLGISLESMSGPAPRVFSGQAVNLLVGDVVFRLEAEGQLIAWRAPACFFDFPSPEDESVVLGHAGFLDYFTATFDGELGELTLLPNDELPRETVS